MLFLTGPNERMVNIIPITHLRLKYDRYKITIIIIYNYNSCIYIYVSHLLLFIGVIKCYKPTKVSLWHHLLGSQVNSQHSSALGKKNLECGDATLLI